MDKRKGIIVAVAIVLVVVVAIVLIAKPGENKPMNNPTAGNSDKYEKYVQVLADGTKVNVSNKLLETKTFNELQITNISLKSKDGITTLIAEVKNNGALKEQQKVAVILEDANGNQIAKLNGVIDRVEAGKTVQLNMTITKDVAYAYNFKIEERQ